MVERDDTGMDALLREALIDARDTLEEADAWGEDLFGDPADPESRSRLVDVVHTVKEACDQLPLPRLEAMAQAATEAADALHEQHRVPSPAAMTTILSAIGRMRDILDTVETEGAEPAGDDAPLIGALCVIAGHEPPASPSGMPKPEADPAAVVAENGWNLAFENDRHESDSDGTEAVDGRRYLIFRTATGGPKALDAVHVAWMDVIDAVADGPDGGAEAIVRGRALPLAALDGVIPEAGRLPAPRPVIVLKAVGRRLALLVEDVLTLTNDPSAHPQPAEIVPVERLFGK